MNDLFALVAGWAPADAAAFRPATEPEIAELRQRAGVELPANLLAFLRAMGQACGRLHDATEDFDVRLALQSYRMTPAEDDRFVRFGFERDPVDPATLCLDLRQPAGGGADAAVVAWPGDAEDPDALPVLAPSLRDLLAQRAFTNIAAADAPQGALLGTALDGKHPPTRDALDVLGKEGFTAALPLQGDPVLVRADTKVLVRRDGGRSIAVQIADHDGKRVTDLIALFVDAGYRLRSRKQP